MARVPATVTSHVLGEPHVPGGRRQVWSEAGNWLGPLPPRRCGFPTFRASFLLVTAHGDRREQGVQAPSSGLGTWASLAERWLILCCPVLRGTGREGGRSSLSGADIRAAGDADRGRASVFLRREPWRGCGPSGWSGRPKRALRGLLQGGSGPPEDWLHVVGRDGACSRVH